MSECTYCKGYPTLEEAQRHENDECTCTGNGCGAGGCKQTERVLEYLRVARLDKYREIENESVVESVRQLMHIPSVIYHCEDCGKIMSSTWRHNSSHTIVELFNTGEYGKQVEKETLRRVKASVDAKLKSDYTKYEGDDCYPCDCRSQTLRWTITKLEQMEKEAQ